MGTRLFLAFKGNKHPFCLLLRRENKITHRALKYVLCHFVNIKEPEELSGIASSENISENGERSPKLRDDWPFLADPACPPELKILAANKITAYHNYTRAHDQLFDCVNEEDQYKTVHSVVENYIENRRIIAEFVYYKEHKHILGNHPVFSEYKEICALRKLTIVELVKVKENLEHNIWRIQSEISKGNKKHLQAEREQRLQAKKNLLDEAERIIINYSK